jgi:biopolymer transport protein ExbD
MRSKKFRQSKGEDVEVPITPMLDMAFQLLTFFVLTYRPAPTEGQFAMNLLPAAPTIDMNAPENPNENQTPSESIPAALRTMTTTLHANPSGALGRVNLGDLEVQGMDELRTKLKDILSDKTLPFDQALIQADPRLKYEELIKVIDIYSDLDITKISFSELTDNGGGPAL